MNEYLKYAGSSSDGRTNKWRVTCPKCGTVFYPPTTRLAFDHVECPNFKKCGVEISIDYNEETLCVLEDR